MSTSEQSNDWKRLLACPDCGNALTAQEDLQCRDCERPFATAGGAINLLPKGNLASEGSEAGDSKYLSGLDRSWKRQFIEHIYARHNLAPVIATALGGVLEQMTSGDWGLNLGSGHTSLHPQLVNLDITPNSGVDILGDAHRLPFQSNSLACVISQEVLEHLPSPAEALSEAFRVLRPGATLFVQVPFIIGAHSLPHDYWRFSKAGLQTIVQASGFEVVDCQPAGGIGTSVYRIGTEFWGALAGCVSRHAYLPAKAAAALLLAPVRLVDGFTSRDTETNRIPPGFYCIAKKPVAD